MNVVIACTFEDEQEKAIQFFRDLSYCPLADWGWVYVWVPLPDVNALTQLAKEAGFKKVNVNK